MALQKTINYRGLEITDAYIKVTDLRVDNINKYIKARFSVYVSNQESKPIDSLASIVEIPMVEGNPLAAIYGHVKSSQWAVGSREHELFNGAIDC